MTTAKKIKRLIDDKIQEFGSAVLTKESELSIQFESVEFRYPSKPEVNILRNLCFQITPNEKVGFVGITGSGKSTIAQLILGFYSPSSGQILINGENMKSFDIKLLRGCIAYVNQEPLLHSTSIKKNITLGIDNCTDDEMLQAAKSSQALEFIEAKPQKFDTFVGNKGSQLSGGEKQRIALARVFIRKPRLIILDEATSALDALTETKIIENLNKAFSDSTIIVIAQRLRTVKDLDCIHYIQDGSIVESGTFDDLCENKGHFYNLLISAQQDNNASQNSKVDQNTLAQDRDMNEGQSCEQTSIAADIRPVINISFFPKNYKNLLLVILISSIISGMAFPFFGYCFAAIIVNLISAENDVKQQNLNVMFYILGDTLALSTSLIALNYFLAKFFSSYTEKIRNNSFSSLVYYDAAFFDDKNNTPSKLSSILRDESQKISSVGGPTLSIPLLLIFAELGGFILAMVQSQILTPIQLVFIIIQIYVIQKTTSFVLGKTNDANSYKINEIASNSLSNFKTMTALNLQELFFKKYLKESEILMEGYVLNSIKIGILYSLRHAQDFFANSAYFFIAANLVKIHVVSTKSIVEVLQIMSSSSWILLLVSVLLPDLAAAKAASNIVSKLLSYTPQIVGKSDKGLQRPILGRVEFCDVSFSYHSKDTNALDSCSFILEPGQSLGVTGKTGSGKSTITMLLLRFYDVSSGFIYIDNKEIKEYNVEYLRSRIAWVGQEPVLFQGSILQNLQLGNAGITREEAVAVLEKAQASDVVECYGIDSDVGVRGSFLSGGQKQRVAIARAFARKCAILILDEATSALDNITDEKLRNALRADSVTVIAIAHKIDTINKCDKIIIIDQGKIVQEGNHETLIRRNGLYRDFSKELS